MSEIASNWLVIIADCSIKAIVLAAIAWAVIRVLNLQDSNLRHRVWTTVLAGMIVLPLLSQVTPAIGLPKIYSSVLKNDDQREPTLASVPASLSESKFSHDLIDANSDQAAEIESQVHSDMVPRDDQEITSRALVSTGTLTPGIVTTGPSSEVSSASPAATTKTAGEPVVAFSPLEVLQRTAPYLFWVWLIGFTLLISRTSLGLIATARIQRAGTGISQDELKELGISACETENVKLYENPIIRVPLTVGVFRTRVLLPSDWLTWSTDKLRAVIAHESEHARRRDTVVMFLAELNRAIHWFHPLSWWLNRRLSVLAESTCDDAAIQSAGDRTQYARHLLEVAARVQLSGGRLQPLGVSMARESNVEQRIHAILDFTRPLSKRLSPASAIALLAVAMSLVAVTSAVKPKPELAVAQDDSTAQENSTSQENSEETDQTTDGLLKYEGVVVDPDGNLVEGAEIRITHWSKSGFPLRVPPVAVTNAKGEFKFEKHKSDFEQHSQAEFWRFANLVASKPGFGSAMVTSLHAETTGQILNALTEEEKRWMLKEMEQPLRMELSSSKTPVRGRVLDTQGNPVPDANVSVINIWKPKADDLTQWREECKRLGANYYSARNLLDSEVGGNFIDGPQASAVPIAVTDDDGRFELVGLGDNRVAEVILSGPGIESKSFHVRSEPGEIVRVARSSRGDDLGNETYYPNEFTHVAGPSQPVIGKVTDADTGEPVVGITVKADRVAGHPLGGGPESGALRAVTDSEGHYKIEGFPIGRNSLILLPNANSPYLTGGFTAKTNADTAPLIKDVKAKKGVLVTGKVIDGETRKAVQGYVQCYAQSDNPHVKDAPMFKRGNTRYLNRTDREGNFSISVLPGQSVLVFNADNHQRYKRGAGAEDLKWQTADDQNGFYRAYPSYLVVNNHHYIKPLNFKPGDQPTPLEITLGSGVEIPVEVVREDGSVPEEFYFLGQNNFGSTWYHEDDAIKVKGYFSSQGRTVMAFDHVQNLIGRVRIDGEPPEKIKIQLSPAAKVTGRLVDDEGEPIAGAVLGNSFKAYREMRDNVPQVSHFLSRIRSRPIMTDKDGNFELIGFMPGQKYSARASVQGKGSMKGNLTSLGNLFEDMIFKPNEVKDLGDVVAVKPEPIQ